MSRPVQTEMFPELHVALNSMDEQINVVKECVVKLDRALEAIKPRQIVPLLPVDIVNYIKEFIPWHWSAEQNFTKFQLFCVADDTRIHESFTKWGKFYTSAYYWDFKRACMEDIMDILREFYHYKMPERLQKILFLREEARREKVGRWKIAFGKHRNRSYFDLMTSEPMYVKWLLTKDLIKDEEVRDYLYKYNEEI